MNLTQLQEQEIQRVKASQKTTLSQGFFIFSVVVSPILLIGAIILFYLGADSRYIRTTAYTMGAIFAIIGVVLLCLSIPSFIKGRKQAAKVKAELAVDDDREFRCLCKVCRHVYCFTTADLRKNAKLLAQAKSDRNLAVMQMAFTSQIQGQMTSADARRAKNQVVDYSRCPKCGSTDVELLPEGAEIPAAPAAASSATAADELMKFKQLLDMGAITQQEYDQKKKELLG